MEYATVSVPLHDIPIESLYKVISMSLKLRSRAESVKLRLTPSNILLAFTCRYEAYDGKSCMLAYTAFKARQNHS